MSGEPTSRLSGEEIAALRFAARRQIARWSKRRDLQPRDQDRRAALIRAVGTLGDLPSTKDVPSTPRRVLASVASAGPADRGALGYRVAAMSPVPETAVRQAVILAGGQSKRLGAYTAGRPKALVEVGGRSILERQVTWLAAGGVERVVVSAGYRAEVLQEFVDTNELPVAVTVVVEDEPLGRGGGLKHAARRCRFPPSDGSGSTAMS